MPTTRSATKKKQTSLEDFKEDGTLKPQKSLPGGGSQSQANSRKAKASPQSKNKANTSVKRAASTSTASKSNKLGPPKKKAKTTQSQLSSDSVNDLEKPIIINRSPVLQLWASVVAQFMHPDQSWQTCLSAGSAIASLCAVSKGKAVGAIDRVDRTEEEERSRKEVAEASKKNASMMEVMGFPLFRKDEKILVSGKPTSLNEETLKAKFGGDNQYDKVRSAMQQALDEKWKNDKSALDKKAFHMYEKFRPNVAKGAAGCGRKGELNVHDVASTIRA